MQTQSPKQAEAPAERVYVPAADVAKACGLSFVTLENHFRPDDWACPRDFRMTRRGIVYAVESLPRLAESLSRVGQNEAARLLREYVAKIATAAKPVAAVKFEDMKPVAVAPVSAGPDELDEAVARCGKRHASDREELPRGWAAEWEGTHE